MSPEAIGNSNPLRTPNNKTIARHHFLALLGPAFVAAVAYVDPGNVAANITAGARYGYLLVWVLVAANILAVIIQYQSAKLGIVTGRSLPEMLRLKLNKPMCIAYFAQAELVAIATDLAEVIGGAISLQILFNIPLLVGGCIVGAISIILLLVQEHNSQRSFEKIVIALLAIITLGFIGGLFISPPDWGQTINGLIPRLKNLDSLLVATSMLGATVMPHAIYLHSALVRSHHAEIGENRRTKRLIKATRIDVVWALSIAGSVNIALLLLAASALQGESGTDTIAGAHSAIAASLGSGVGIIFALGLLASGLASTSVGAYAGTEIMRGLLDTRIPLLAQRVITLLPALGIIALGAEPTWSLVISQVVLSFGIPFALIPLIYLTGSAQVMGQWRDGIWLRWIARLAASLIIVLNLALLWLTIADHV